MTPKRVVLLAVALLSLAALTAYYVLPAWPEPVQTISQHWEASTHADVDSGAFTNWNEDEPPVIPESCAKCHSTYGYRDYLGEDGSTVRQVDQPAKTGTTVYCIACHNESAHSMTRVDFPDGAQIDGLGLEANCMRCHQNRRSTGDVDQAIEGREADSISDELSFINVHYYVAAGTWLGTEAQAGYEYPGRAYVARFEHVPDMQSCIECHDPHSQRVDDQACSPCHTDVVEWTDLRDIRTGDTDFDGDGLADEGLHGEIDTLRTQVYSALQAYAADVIGTPLIYADSYPYFFIDSNANGAADADETNFGNGYATWTPRLVRTAYNYHFSLQDAGNYAHNGRYVLQLLYDSLDDLGERVSVDLEALSRPTAE